jgi:hypothetical protein
VAVLNELQVGRFNRLVQKLLSLKGHASLTQLRGEMGVEIPIFHGAENRYLESWDLFHQPAIATPGAATIFVAEARNPAGSNVIAVFSQITYWSPGGDTANPGPNLVISRGETVDQPTAAPPQQIDKRGRTSSTILISENNGAVTSVLNGTLTTIGRGLAPANTELRFLHQELPLLPGDAFAVRSVVLAAAGIVVFSWRERFLEESERT